MLRHMCTWSPIRRPSSTCESFCLAHSRNSSPNCRRSASNIFFFRFFGINTTWHLQSHHVWLKLWYSFIVISISWSRLKIHKDRRIGQTLVSPPAYPGAYLTELWRLSPSVPDALFASEHRQWDVNSARDGAMRDNTRPAVNYPRPKTKASRYGSSR